MTTAQIKALQRHIWTEDDGFWGPASIAACQSHLRKLMPRNTGFPGTSQFELNQYYGAAGDESQLVNLPVAGVQYSGKPVKTIRCHRKCAETLSSILMELATVAPGILKKYDGCYNNRKMRGGSLPSLHARGAAIDFDQANNGNSWHWPIEATMPIEVMEVFSRHGWVSAGAFWSRDAMHFQMTQ